jgi:hypothetical protein
MKKVTIILAVVVPLLALGTSAAYAAQDSLPGDAIYPLKLGTEQVTMLLPGEDVVKAERALSFVEQRVREMEALAEKGRSQDMDVAVDKYDYSLNTLLDWMERACSKGLPAGNITACVAEAMARHLSILDTVYDIVPDETKAAIAQAEEVSEKGRQNALMALARNNTV